MKILYIGILRGQNKDAVELAAEHELSSFNYFTKKDGIKMMTFFAVTAAGRTNVGDRYALNNDEAPYIIHTHGRPNGISAVILSDEEYPKMVAQSLLSKVCSEFLERYPISTIKNAQPNSLPYPELKDYLVKYQDPGQADSMMKIQNELDETVVVMQKNISVMMDRGEKLDDLVQKSETLSAQSKMFYTQAKKQNSCCIVM